VHTQLGGCLIALLRAKWRPIWPNGGQLTETDTGISTNLTSYR